MLQLGASILLQQYSSIPDSRSNNLPANVADVGIRNPGAQRIALSTTTVVAQHSTRLQQQGVGVLSFAQNVFFFSKYNPQNKYTHDGRLLFGHTKLEDEAKP